MKKYIVSFILLFSLFQGCKNERRNKDLESPLATIIKMQSAEQLLEFEEAKKYVDVNKIYKDPDNDTASAEDIWKSMLVFQNNLGKSNKFTNQVKYFNYHIVESVNGENAEVFFNAKDRDATIQSIIYKLTLINGSWIVNSIEYKKLK